jgi:hypothetical protein
LHAVRRRIGPNAFERTLLESLRIELGVDDSANHFTERIGHLTLSRFDALQHVGLDAFQLSIHPREP